jgi:hypothetical protein
MARANGEFNKYVGRGRFAEKGGQQVDSFFDVSSDNEKIKHIYGNYGFWSWLRYWYIDTANQVTMMLIDKGYYDYDFERKKGTVRKKSYEGSIKSDSEVRTLLARFGIGKVKEEKSIDYLQKMAMKELSEM